ncbi:glutaredoxin domain-containing protein [Mycetocola saprophilus]|uniref:glutaredoxin domain-containing protein n=1 Tax=Mycetocola saprophilus TaxID=76636 RepID=UPI0004C1353F|nr:glutaredoxin domain-containing protein [Mycetocola saprophilus]
MTQIVTVYSKADCRQCDATKRWLTSHNVDFEVDDITEPGNLAAVKALGYQAAPVVMVSNGDVRADRHWSGFDPGKLDTLLDGDA